MGPNVNPGSYSLNRQVIFKMCHSVFQLPEKAKTVCCRADSRSLMRVFEGDQEAMFPYSKHALGLELCFLERAELQDTRKQVGPGI